MRPRATMIVLAVLVLTMGCVHQPDDIPIGVIGVLSGDAAIYGIPPRRGIELAVSEINEAGGIQGKKVRLVVEDDKCEPKTGTSAALKLISHDKVHVIVGAICSSVTLAIAPIANEKHVVLFSPQSSSPKITAAGDWVFRNWPSDVIEGRIGADFAAGNLKAKTAAVLYITNDYGLGVKTVFEERFTALGNNALHRNL